MSATSAVQSVSPEARPAEVIISADSHVMEPHDLWVKRLPAAFREQAPRFPEPKLGEGFQAHPGGHDPHERVKEMAVDGVSAEVLYPTLALSLFGLDDAALQEACFQVYNDWLIEYCQVAPERLVGIPAIAVYDVDHGIRELERCRKAGLKGALIWMAPHPDLPFHSEHYERFWAAAQDLDMPISLHILTGHSYFKNVDLHTNTRRGVEHYRGSVNLKLLDAANALFDFIFYGILERYPRLKVVIVETEIGWLPFYLQQWDYYFRRFRKTNPPPIDKEPSEYFARQIYATFFNDAVGGRNLAWDRVDNYMWSNDFPHPNSTWPNSRKVIERDLGHLPPEKRAKLVRENVVRLYNLAVPEPV
ncbi:MAG TPA: amidohydrolase family protein [Chloroflexota bacterium]|nr:amidohydrolase family protein [Chloroflexota bacterium]